MSGQSRNAGKGTLARRALNARQRVDLIQWKGFKTRTLNCALLFLEVGDSAPSFTGDH